MAARASSYARCKGLVQEAAALQDAKQYRGALDACTAAIHLIEDEMTRNASLATDSAWRNLIGLAYNNRGFIKYMCVDFDDAIQDYTKALEYEDLPVYRYNRGLIHYRLAQFDDSVHDMQNALKLDASFECARKCLEQSKRDKQAKLQREQATRGGGGE